MKKKILSSLLLLSCGLAYSSQPAGASATPDSPEQFNLPSFKQGHVVFEAGGFWSHQGKAQHIDIDGAVGDDFTLNKHHGSNGLVGLGYFIDGQNFDPLQLSYGINFFYLPKTSVTGTVVQEDLFTNLSYSYHLTHYPVYAIAKAKMNLPVHKLLLTVDAGIGPNFINAKGFSEHSLDGGITIPDNAFSNHTSTTFSATAGVGLQLAQVFGEMPVECGYRYFYLGQGRLSKNTDQIPNKLHTGHAYANAVLCAVHI